MFTRLTLDHDQNLFHTLEGTTEFEEITAGRKGAVLVNNSDGRIPLVRTTTMYKNPVQKFKLVHYNIMNSIRQKAREICPEFNNALIEVYDNKYCTMGFHSDQALDLAEDSYIAVYSCYENPNEASERKLIINNKISNETSEIVMIHDSVILFGMDVNRQHLHKIILENNKTNNRWLGITFRLSKTFIKYIDDKPIICQTNSVLNLATDEERKMFYKLRGMENNNPDFVYPEINYTISASDLIKI